jgi:hypothetical protein
MGYVHKKREGCPSQESVQLLAGDRVLDTKDCKLLDNFSRERANLPHIVTPLFVL